MSVETRVKSKKQPGSCQLLFLVDMVGQSNLDWLSRVVF